MSLFLGAFKNKITDKKSATNAKIPATCKSPILIKGASPKGTKALAKTRASFEAFNRASSEANQVTKHRKAAKAQCKNKHNSSLKSAASDHGL